MKLYSIKKVMVFVCTGTNLFDWLWVSELINHKERHQAHCVQQLSPSRRTFYSRKKISRRIFLIVSILNRRTSWGIVRWMNCTFYKKRLLSPSTVNYLDICPCYRALSVSFSQHNLVLHSLVLDCRRSDAWFVYHLHKRVSNWSILTIDPSDLHGLVLLKFQKKTHIHIHIGYLYHIIWLYPSSKKTCTDQLCIYVTSHYHEN